MLVMVVFFIALRWIHLSTPLIRLFLLVLILLLMPTLNFLPVWFALSLVRFRLPSRLPMMFFLFFQAEEGIRNWSVTGVQSCALPILALRHDRFLPVAGERLDNDVAVGVGRGDAEHRLPAHAVERFQHRVALDVDEFPELRGQACQDRKSVV